MNEKEVSAFWSDGCSCGHKPSGNKDDITYQFDLSILQENFTQAVKNQKILFTVPTSGLFELYLNHFGSNRQYHNCKSCAAFIRRIGGAVTIDNEGCLTSVVWNRAGIRDPQLANAMHALKHEVEIRRVSGVLNIRPSEGYIGTYEDDGWIHFSLTIPQSLRMTEPSTMSYPFRRDCLVRSIHQFPTYVFKSAVALLKSGSLNDGFKFVPHAEWLVNLAEFRDGVRLPSWTFHNLLWKRSALAPAGWCAINGTALGRLLKMIQVGAPAREIERTWNPMVRSDNYMRPKADPAPGNIEAAEKAVKELGYEKSFVRRQACLTEIQYCWNASKEPEMDNGVFSVLKEKHKRIEMPMKTVTLRTFIEDIRPEALAIEIELPAFGNYGCFTAPVHPDSKNPFQWDNQFCWYMYTGGSPRSRWWSGHHIQYVYGIAPTPHMWNPAYRHNHREGFMFVVEGLNDTGEPGVCLFPALMKSELHPYRSTIEAYSNQGKLEKIQGPPAVGVVFDEGTSGGLRVAVWRSGNVVTPYTIDRWK